MKPVAKNNYMQPLKGRIRKKTFIGFDIETQGEENTFVSCAVWSHEEQHFFTDKQELIEYMLARKNSGKTFVATNLSFDFTGIYWNSDYWNDHFIIFRGSRIMLAEYAHKNKRAKTQYIDTMNYAPFSVKKLGKIIGIEKRKPPEWLGTRAPQTPEEWRVYEEYNMQDAKISCLFMEYLQESVNALGGQLQISAASTALDLYRRKYQQQGVIKEQHYIKDVKKFIFQGYYGGRTEAISRGRIENMNYYDVNSLYPAVMRNKYPFPNSVKNVKNPSLDNIIHYEGVSECLVTCPYMKYPLLPLRRDGKLLFPIGSFRGVWNNVELRKALELGYKIIPVKQIIYTKTYYPFENFVTDLYAKRIEEKKKGSSMQVIIKLIMNSLYGKFAQKNLEHYEIKDFSSFSREEKEKIWFHSDDRGIDLIDGKYIYRKEKESDGVFSLPILSSYCTSYARLLLYEYVVKTNPVYMDTDSIFTKETLPDSSVLGQMKLEKKIEIGIIIRPKLYYDGSDVKAKGIHSPTFTDFENILHQKEVEKMRFMTIKSGIRRGITPNSILYETKEIDLEDSKRVWSAPFTHTERQESEPLCIIEDG